MASRRLPGRTGFLLAFVVALLMPSAAHAWGAPAHIDFAMEALRWLAVAAPAVRLLLLRHPEPFLYGSVVADVVVGKNRAPQRLHCHRWEAGMELVEAASDPAERAFAFGYASHLAADSVAHGEYVPAKLVESFEGRGLRHAYWELRFDSRALQRRPDLRAVWLDLSRARFPRLDRFLAGHLHPAVLSHGASRGIFAGSMLFQRRRAWMRAARRIDHRSTFPLSGGEFDWYRERAVEAILRFLSDPEGRVDPPPDPVGAEPIASALALRKDLRRARRAHALPARAWLAMGPALRDAVAARRPLADVVAGLLDGGREPRSPS